MKKSLDDYKRDYVGKTFGWLTITDIIRSTKTGRITGVGICRCGKPVTRELRKITCCKIASCGCYNTSKEKGDAVRQWHIDNPDLHNAMIDKVIAWRFSNPSKLDEISNKISQWYEDNPEKVKEKAAAFSKYCKDHPDMVELSIIKRKQTLNDNPDILNKAREKQIKFWKDNPDKLAERSRKHSKWYKDNPNEVAKRSNKISLWYKLNKDSVVQYSARRKNKNRLRRIKLTSDINFSFVHPDDVHFILEGAPSNTFVRTKCPLCGNYSSHRLYSFISYNKRSAIKPLCSDCCNIHTASALECDIYDYVSTFYSGKCLRNSRTIISPDELDLFYPDAGIAIEVNGTYWHSDIFKERNYHYNKYRRCYDKGILLVSVFEKDWLLDCDSLKRYLYNLFNNINDVLSFDKSGYMNNNYPAPTGISLDITADIIPDYYIFKNLKVHTCGYTKILGTYNHT